MAAEILHVGDSVVVEGRGRVVVEDIDVALRPSTDPAAELHFVRVKAVELGEHGPPITINFAGHWAYGAQVDAETVERGEG